MVNPLILFFSLALVLFALLFCILHKPKKPVMSPLLILLLIVFLSCTFVLNNALTINPDQPVVFTHLQKLLPLLTAVRNPTAEQCEQAFRSYQIIDICLFAATLISMILEVWLLLIRSDRPDSPTD